MCASSSATLAPLESSSRVGPVASDSSVNRPTDRAIYVTCLHWRTLVPELLVVAAAALFWKIPVELLRAWTTMLFGIVEGSRFTLTVELVRVGALTLLIIGLSISLAELVVLAAARFSVTTRTVILKTGLLKRRYFELPLDRVEAITVGQSMLARLLNYGTVVVAGIGSTREVVRCLARPHEFRRHVMEQSDQRRLV